MASKMSGLPNPDFWDRRRVLVTGHTGFKGAWLTRWLQRLGAEVMGLSLPQPVSQPNLWELLAVRGVRDTRVDLTGQDWQEPAAAFRPEIIMHLAAQSLVPRGYSAPADTFASNVMGTVRVLDALQSLPSVVALLVATTDKVYDTRQSTPFVESAFLGGSDPYSASKACTELVVRSWPTSLPVGCARAGNVVGGGDWAPDRLVPDLDRAWRHDERLVLRRPNAVRPWQHVLEPLRAYLLYVESLAQTPHTPSAMNFGPSRDQCVPVGQFVEHAADLWERLSSVRPAWTSLKESPIVETDVLELDSSLADANLGWRNVLDWRESVESTLEWHFHYRSGDPALDLVDGQIDMYCARAETTS